MADEELIDLMDRIEAFRLEYRTRLHAEAICALEDTEMLIRGIVTENEQLRQQMSAGQVYIAIKDWRNRIIGRDSRSVILGAFTTEELARAACQADSDEDDDGAGHKVLAWEDDSAEMARPFRMSVTYTVRLVQMDEATSC